MYNKMTAIGNVGSDPEMRYTPSGSAVTSFRLATGRSYTTRDGERRDETEWFTVKAWNRLAETCNQFVVKGMRVYVEGRLRSTSWVGNDGQMRFRNEIVAQEVKFLNRPQQGGGGYGGDGSQGGYDGGGYGGSQGGPGGRGDYGGYPGDGGYGGEPQGGGQSSVGDEYGGYGGYGGGGYGGDMPPDESSDEDSLPW